MEPQLDVAYIAELSKLDLSPEETERFSQDLNQILEHVRKLDAWDTEGVEPMYHPLPAFDALRADVPGESLPNAAALANAPAAQEGQFRVPKVVESAH